jgi:hypothetical protein
MAWQDSYNPKCPPDRPYNAEDGSGCVEKPDNSNKGYMEAGIMDENGNWTPGGQARKQQMDAQKNQKPPDPTTFGNQLSMTGNPMQDMLISQFNQGQNTTYGQGNNIFGLGEDRAVGGTGANADKQGQVQGQSLSGGGLWWGQGDATFKGEDGKAFRADTKNSDEAIGQSPGVKPPAQVDPAQQQQQPAAAPIQQAMGGGRQVTRARPRNVAGMMYNQMSQNPLGQR